MQNIILTKPGTIKKDKEEILIQQYNTKTQTTTNKRITPKQINTLTLISDNLSITKGAIKLLQGKNITIISKGETIATINWTTKQNTINKYSKKMSQLPKSKQKKIAFKFCKAVCSQRIKQVTRLNEKRNNPTLKENLKKMQTLQKQLIKKTKDTQKMKAIEGNIAKYFFSSIRELLPKKTNFEERNRDSEDLYNVLLNATHGVLRSRIKKILTARGINTSFGFLHYQENKDKPFLVWDFAEFWIPKVDKICFYIINKNIITEKSLINAKNKHGKWLNNSAWEKIYKIMDQRISEKELESKVNEFANFLDGKNNFSWVL